MGKYYAIGFKGWVELRQSLTKPKAVKSILETEVEQTTYIISDSWPYSEPKKVMKMKEFTSTFYDGGKVLRTISYSKFRKLTGLSVGAGIMIPISKVEADEVLKSRGYGQ